MVSQDNAPDVHPAIRLRTVLLLLGLSLLTRGAYLLAVRGPDAPLVGDEPGFHQIAAGCLAGEGWHDGPYYSTRAPLPSAILIPIYALTGARPEVGRWTMVAISSWVAPLLYVIERWGFKRRLALAGWIWALYPPSIFYASFLLSENLAATLSAACLGTFIASGLTRRVGLAFLTGILWAALALTRPVFLLLPFFLLGMNLLLPRTTPGRWGGRSTVLALAGFALAMAPWTIRNAVVHHRFMPTTSYGGIMLSSTNATLGHPAVQSGAYYHDPEIRRPLQQLPEVEWNAAGLQLAVERIRQYPGLFLEAVAHRAVNFWSPRPNPYNPNWSASDGIMLALWLPLLLAFALSFTRHPWREDWPVLGMILYATLSILPFWGTPRFRFPVDPQIILRASAGLIWLPSIWGHLVTRLKRPRRADSHHPDS